MEVVEFLENERKELKERIKEYLDKGFDITKLNEKLKYIEYLESKTTINLSEEELPL